MCPSKWFALSRGRAAHPLPPPPLFLVIQTTLVIIAVNCVRFSAASIDLPSKAGKCERITIPMCQDMPYNLTRMPNIMGHHKQSDAAIEVHEFIPLVEIGCSKNLKFFLCSLYAPMCSEQVDTPIPSCQSICEDVKSLCLPVLEQYKFAWPPLLNCSRLPVPETGVCMEFPSHMNDERRRANKSSSASLPSRSDAESSARGEILSGKTNVPLFNSIKAMNFDRQPHVRKKENGLSLAPLSRYPHFGRESGGFQNPSKSIPIDVFRLERAEGFSNCPFDFVYIPITRKDRNCTHICVQKCGKDVLFTSRDKNFLSIWMAALAATCFISTLFTTFTFWIDSTQFRYPERPIAFLSICYCLSCTAFLIRIYAGSEFVSCDKTDLGKYHLTVEGLENSGCIIVFLLLYYFGLAATMWWVVLTFAWYLVSVKKWAHEAVESKASYFHLAAWALPGIFTIIVLTLRHVDGDELTGMCFVGYQEPKALFSFVIVPASVALGLGSLTLLKGYLTNLCRTSSLIKSTDTNGVNGSAAGGAAPPVGAGSGSGGGGGGGATSVLEQSRLTTSNVGMFALLYTIPALCVVGCQLYEYNNLNHWHTMAKERALHCQAASSESSCRLTESIPLKEVFVLKTFMALVLGIFCGIWNWNSKTWTTWSRFCYGNFGRRQRRNFKTPSSCPVIHHSSYVQIGPHGVTTQSVSSSCSVPQIHRLQQHLYPYASIKSHRSTRTHHKRASEITQL